MNAAEFLWQSVLTIYTCKKIMNAKSELQQRSSKGTVIDIKQWPYNSPAATQQSQCIE